MDTDAEQQVATGWRGVITRRQTDQGRVATKRAKHPQAAGAIAKEVQILRYLQRHQIRWVPQLVDTGPGRFSYPWIEGEHFETIWKQLSPSQQSELAVQLLERAYQLDQLGVVHGELIRPRTNVLVRPDGQIALIDFERGRLGDQSGKNMRALSQRLAGQKLIDLSVCRHIGTLSIEEIYRYLQDRLSSPKTKRDVDWCRLGLLCGLIGLDQISKYWLYDQQRKADWWLFTPSFNTGVGRSLPVPLTVTLLVTLLTVMFVVYVWSKRRYPPLLLVLLCAGAIGNGIDRWRLGGVRDFIDLHVWPIFNLADVYLSLAVLIYLFYLWRSDESPAPS